MKINKSRHRSSRNTSRRKYKNINKSRKRIKKTHKKYLVRLKKYNKNIRHRKYYTRKVNRYKRGGAELQPITAEFNFSFPANYNGKLSDLTNSTTSIQTIVGGWGYVTKAGLLHRKNRPEQLIVYQKSSSPETYFIARCTFSDCRIRENTLTESHMEKTIEVSKDGFKVAQAQAPNSLIVTFKNDNNESYTIEVVKKYLTEDKLYNFFYHILMNPTTGVARSARVAIDHYLPTTAADNIVIRQCESYLIDFRRNPELLAVLVDSIARSKDKTRDIDICFKIISNHILPLKPLEPVVEDTQTIIEKQFATMLYYLCKETINKIANKTKDTIGLAISKDSNLFTKLVTYYSSMRGNIFLSSILKTILETILEKVKQSTKPDQTTMVNFAISILRLILENIKELPIGFKCISAAIYNELGSNELGSSYDIAFIQAQILNLICIKLISPYFFNRFKDNLNLIQVVYFMQKIATNNEVFLKSIDLKTIETKETIETINSLHSYANIQLSAENLDCDMLVVSDTTLLDNYSYNLEKQKLTSEDFEKFKDLIKR